VPRGNHREVGGIQRTLCTLTFCKYRTHPRRDMNPLKATRCYPSEPNDRTLDPSATAPPSESGSALQNMLTSPRQVGHVACLSPVDSGASGTLKPSGRMSIADSPNMLTTLVLLLLESASELMLELLLCTSCSTARRPVCGEYTCCVTPCLTLDAGNCSASRCPGVARNGVDVIVVIVVAEAVAGGGRVVLQLADA
jgi:hypothetical protein